MTSVVARHISHEFGTFNPDYDAPGAARLAEPAADSSTSPASFRLVQLSPPVGTAAKVVSAAATRLADRAATAAAAPLPGTAVCSPDDGTAASAVFAAAAEKRGVVQLHSLEFQDP